jgi:formate/nitrite transporter
MEELNNYIEVGVGKTKNKPLKTIVLSIMAGFLIALAGYASTVVSFNINNFSISKLLAALIFPMGLILVVLLKTELFTGNSLLVIPFVNKKISLKSLLLNWLLVYIGNFIGSILLSLLIYKSGSLTNETLINAFVNIANKKVSYNFINLLILGTLCNILVCTAVFLGVTSKNIIDKIFVIFIPIFLFVVLGFEHSVANMFYLSIGALLGKLSFINLIIHNLLPVTLGNMIGGILIGLIFHYTKSK